MSSLFSFVGEKNLGSNRLRNSLWVVETERKPHFYLALLLGKKKIRIKHFLFLLVDLI